MVMRGYCLIGIERVASFWQDANFRVARFITFLFLTQIALSVWAASSTVFVPVGENQQRLATQIEYIDDPDGTYTIEDVLAQGASFKPFDTSTHNFDYAKKVLWI